MPVEITTSPRQVVVVKEQRDVVVQKEQRDVVVERESREVAVTHEQRVVEIDSDGSQGPPGAPGGASDIPPIHFSYGDASPSTIHVSAHDGTWTFVRVLIGTAFNGIAPSLRIGIMGDVEAFMPANGNDPTLASDYESSPDLHLPAGTPIILTIVPGMSATTGAGRILLDFVPD